MTTKSHRQKLLRYRTYLISRAIACVSFILLAIIAASSLVRAITLHNVPAQDGVPTAWNNSALKAPPSITVPITYWDQRIDACDLPDRQFEWGKCHYWTKGALQGIVQNTLSNDHLPIPTFSDSNSAWAANHDIFTANVTGHNPVLPTDNFYRWFHEVDGLSKLISGRSVTFKRTGDTSTYVYGGQHIYPLDDLAGFDSGDLKLRGADGKMHNFHFTGHLRIAMRISASGEERFLFSGDDDVWVFLNNHLVLDIGGLHEPLAGWFTINPDGTIKTHVDSVSNVADRTDELTECMKVVRNANSACNNNFNNFLAVTNQPADRTVNAGISAGDIVYLDFFYAERSSDGSNTKITIENMDWPISAVPTLTGKIVQELETSNIVEFNTSVTNYDPDHELKLERIASHIIDNTANDSYQGFLPLNSDTLFYTSDPSDDNSWRAVNISLPADNSQGFALDAPLTLSPYGSTGDTLYFRYYTETADTQGNISNTISYYTSINGANKVVHTDTTLPYAQTTTEKPNQPIAPTQPNESTNQLPQSDLIAGDLLFVSPLGVVAYTPNTGLVDSAITLFNTEFATIILSQYFTMAILLIFAASFALFVSFHQYNQKPQLRRANAKVTKKPRPSNKK